MDPDRPAVLSRFASATGLLAAMTALAAAVAGALGGIDGLPTVDAAWLRVLTVRLSIVSADLAIVTVVIQHRLAQLAGWRRLDGMQRSIVTNRLSELTPKPIIFAAPGADWEARSYTRQLLRLFRDAGWPARVRLSLDLHNSTNVDVLVCSSNFSSEFADTYHVLRALQESGIRAARGKSAQAIEGPAILLEVGRKAIAMETVG